MKRVLIVLSTKRWAVVFMLSICTLVLQESLQAQLMRDSVSMYCCTPEVSWNSYCGGSTQKGIIWVHMHENETTVPPVAIQVIDSMQQGCFVTWKHDGNRNMTITMKGKTYRFDPNRIYTREGVAATLAAQSTYDSAAAFYVYSLGRQFTRAFVDVNKFVVAMHNNSNGGGLDINSFTKGGPYEQDAAEVAVQPNEDPDDFYLTTDKRIYDYLKQAGFNIVLQDNSKVQNDGSLSVYCGYLGIPYLNIEAELGHFAEQKKMMLAVVQMIRELGLGLP